ncbi:MAG TPA: hypothetical protein VD927_06275 [Chryseosolibacter sp.]|nr:hypothetical protein [Chryseosolibacter sp.]
MKSLQKFFDEAMPDVFIRNSNPDVSDISVDVLSRPYDVILSYTRGGEKEDVLLTEGSFSKFYSNQDPSDSIVLLDDGRDFLCEEVFFAAYSGKTVGSDGEFLACEEVRLIQHLDISVVLFYHN